MTALVLRSDAGRLPLQDASVDMIVTSPPYFALRSYTDGGQHYAGQLGSESTPAEYIAALVACTREWMRVLKPSGSIFVNLGDKYAGAAPGQRTLPNRHAANTAWEGPRRKASADVPNKSLMLLPERYRIACVDDLGLIARAVLVWCLSGGARVYARLPGGDRPIMLRDLVRAYQPEQVQLWNGEKWTQVRGWNRTSDDDGAVEIELRTGERVGCTPNHQWPTQRGLLRADELRVGDVIQTTTLPEPEAPRRPLHLDDHLIGWFVGLYIAEGSRSGQTIQIAGHADETERHAKLRAIAAAYDGQCAVYQTSENGSTCNLSGSVLLGILDRYVSPGTAKTKRLRLAAWQRNDAFLYGVMTGYLDGDGHYDAKNDRWRLGFTANDEWAADLRTLAARLGSVVRLRRCVHKMGEQEFPGWRGEWRHERSWHHNARPDGEIVAIRASRARDFYDLGVADEPYLFALASGVLTHNSKPNGLPESVTDRVRRSHEDWVHLTKQPRYYAAVDAIREPAQRRVGALSWAARRARGDDSRYGEQRISTPGDGGMGAHPLGKLPGSVWEVATEPLRRVPGIDVDHYAAFPTEWPRRLILGWSPAGICTACGEGRRPVRVVDWTQVPHHIEHRRTLSDDEIHEWCAAFAAWCAETGVTRAALDQLCGTDGMGRHWTNPGRLGSQIPTPEQWSLIRVALDPPALLDRLVTGTTPVRVADFAIPGGAEIGRHRAVQSGRSGAHIITGYACACPDTTAPTRPAVVLDPFGGTGTTAHVATALGRTGITVDLSRDYCRLAAAPELADVRRRKVLGLDKAEPVHEGQTDLLPELSGAA